MRVFIAYSLSSSFAAFLEDDLERVVLLLEFPAFLEPEDDVVDLLFVFLVDFEVFAIVIRFLIMVVNFLIEKLIGDVL